jgi:hypothetical protein
MIRNFSLAFLTIALSIAAHGRAWATQYFNIHNNSSNGTIVAMWVSPHSIRQWGNQVLRSPVYPGTFHHISWDRTQPWEWYDLRLRFANGYTAVWTERPVNLHLANNVYINWYNGTLHANTD